MLHIDFSQVTAISGQCQDLLSQKSIYFYDACTLVYDVLYAEFSPVACIQTKYDPVTCIQTKYDPVACIQMKYDPVAWIYMISFDNMICNFDHHALQILKQYNFDCCLKWLQRLIKVNTESNMDRRE